MAASLVERMHVKTARAWRGRPRSDYAKAREWFEKATDKGSAEAMTSLRLLYSQGRSVTQDYGMAREWFKKAAEKGDLLARKYLSR